MIICSIYRRFDRFLCCWPEPLLSSFCCWSSVTALKRNFPIRRKNYWFFLLISLLFSTNIIIINSSSLSTLTTFICIFIIHSIRSRSSYCCCFTFLFIIISISISTWKKNVLINNYVNRNKTNFSVFVFRPRRPPRPPRPLRKPRLPRTG